jgi:hypothetical protein
MRSRRRHFLAVLVAAVSIALSAAPAPAGSAEAARSDVHHCPYGTAWDNLLHRCS